jgi:choline dehydrogenase-like flavoprotein
MSLPFVIVGSGPAGVSAAYSLLRKGLPVTMLDVGYRLEPGHQELLDRLAGSPPEHWQDADLAALRRGTDPDVKGLPKKLAYGSSYPYRVPEDLVVYERRGAETLASHALGGLSNAWGANVLPFDDSDLAGWPIGAADLDPYYRAVFTFVDLSAHEDRLSRRFPLHTDRPRPLHPSRQARALMADLEAHREALARRGFEYGYSRLAVRTEPKDGGAGCAYCGLCLYGCPYGLIYSSAHSLPELREFPRFQYVPGVYVERIEESARGVTAHARRVEAGSAETFPAERVFLGCGTYSTSKIVLESLGATGREILVRDSQYFLAPLLRWRSEHRVASERLHTLSQVCLELADRAISDHPIHMLIYTYNDLYARALEKLGGRLVRPLRPVVEWLLARLLIVQGYLHSGDSRSIAMRVERRAGSPRAHVVLEGRPNPRTAPVLRKVLAGLRGAAGALRGLVVPGLTHVSPPGKSYHVGASLPMRQSPGELECDRLGRPGGLSRTHVIDASCFTTIPAVNLTLTVMANAYRIADQGVDA